MDFAGMKRKELQALCKKHGIPANLANREMAHRLALLLQEDEKLAVRDRETEPVVVAKNNVKKVKFSPENETFIFIGSDSDSGSDHVFERTIRFRSRKSMRKNAAKRKKIEEEKNVTVVVRVAKRSQAKSVSVLEEDSKLISLAVKGRKRGPEIVDSSEPKRESTGRQLRRGKLVNEAAGNGDMVVSGDKITREVSKKTVDGKAGDGVLSEGQVFEDAEAEEAPEPEKMNKISKQSLMKDKGSGVAPTEGIAKVGIGGKTTRAAKRKKIEERNVDGKVRVVKRSQAKSVSVLEEDIKLVSLPVKGRKRGPEIVDVSESKRVSTGRQLRRGKLVNEAGGNGDMVVSGDKITREGSKKTVDGKAGDGALLEGQVFENAEAEEAPKPEKISKNSEQNSTKDKGSGVAPTEGIAKVGIGGKTTRARTLAFGTGSAVDRECEEPLKGQAKNETTMEKNPRKRPKKQDLEEVSDIRTNSDANEQFVPQGPMRRTRRITRLFSPDGLTVSTNEENPETMNQERGANRGNPTRQSARVSSKVAEIAESASKKVQKKQRQDPTFNQQSFVNVQEPSNNKHPRRSTLDASKGNNVELVEPTLMGSATEKEKLKTSSLLVEESPVIDVELAAPEALESKIDPDSHCNKGNTPRSSENRKEFRRKSALASPLHSAPGSAVNEVATDTILDLDGQVSSSAKHQGISVIEPTMESAIELLIKEKESSTIEEVKENSRGENIEGGADDPLRNSLDTGGDSCDYQLVQQVEDSKKDIDVDAIIPDSSFSPTNQVNSEGERSNHLDIDGHKGAAEEATSVNDDSLTPDQHLCDKGTHNVVKQTEGALDFRAMDGKPTRDDDLQKVGALDDLSFCSEMIQNMNVNCFVSSSDKRNSEHHVHTAVVTPLVINTSLSSGEEANVEYARDLFVEANSGSENAMGKKEIDENVTTTEDFDQVFESQLGEQDHHTNEPAVSNDQISGDCKDSNEQDDVSAIIQEYMDREIRMDEVAKMDSSTPPNEGKMTRVLMEDAETISVAELGLDKIFNDCGEKDEQTLATGTKRMETVEEDKGTVVDAMELPKTNDAAPTDCTDVVPVNCKISETSNVDRETTRQSDEVKIEDVESNMEVSTELEGSASMALDNSGFRDGKVTTSKGKVGIVCGDSNSQAINFLAETKLNEDSVPDIFSDDIHDKLVYKEAHGWNDNDPDTALVSTHGKKAVLIDESGDENLEGQIGSDDVEYGSELHREALNSPPKVEESCRLDEKNSTAIKLMVDSTICSPLTGKESECQAYKKCATNCLEGMKLENMDGAIIPREIDSLKQGNIELGSYQRGSQHRRHSLKEGCQTDDVDFLELNKLFSSNSPKQGNIELGSYQRGSQHRRRSLKEGCQADDIDFLELNNLFRSNSSKSNFKQTGKDLDFQNSANLEVPVGASKDATGLEEVQCPAVSLVTPDSNASMRLTTTEFPAGRKLENNTADSDADLPLFTGFELNLFSEDCQREEVDKSYHRRLEEKLMNDTNVDMKRGDTAVNISTGSVEQGLHLENEIVVDIDFLKQTQPVASDGPNNEIEGSMQEAMASEVSVKAIKIIEGSGASAKSPWCDENNAQVASNYKSSGSKDVTSFGMTSLEEVMVEATDWNKYGLEVNATTINAASDGLVIECRGSAEKGGVFVESEGAIEFENTIYFASSGEPTAECGADDSKQVESSYLEEIGTEVITALIKNDSSEDMFEATDLSKGALVTNVESLDVATDEPIFGNRGTNDKCNVSIINQESVDCKNTNDDFVELEKCQETADIEGSSSVSSKHTTEFGRKDPNKGPLNLDVEAAVSEDAQARQADFEFGQENSSVTNLCQSINQFANPARMNNINVSIPATPKILQKAHDMKENFPSAKREQFGSVAVSRKSAKRRPLEDLQKN